MAEANPNPLEKAMLFADIADIADIVDVATDPTMVDAEEADIRVNMMTSSPISSC